MRLCALVVLAFSVQQSVLHNSWNQQRTNLAPLLTKEKTAVEETGQGVVLPGIGSQETIQTEEGAFPFAPTPYLVVESDSETHPGAGSNDLVLQRMPNSELGPKGEMCSMSEALATDMEAQAVQESKSEKDEERSASSSCQGHQDARSKARRLRALPNHRSMGTEHTAVQAECQESGKCPRECEGFAVAAATNPSTTSTASCRDTTGCHDRRRTASTDPFTWPAEDYGVASRHAGEAGISRTEAGQHCSDDHFVAFSLEPDEEVERTSKCSCKSNQIPGFRMEDFLQSGHDQGATPQQLVSAVSSRAAQSLQSQTRRADRAEGGSERSFPFAVGARDSTYGRSGGTRRFRVNSDSSDGGLRHRCGRGYGSGIDPQRWRGSPNRAQSREGQNGFPFLSVTTAGGKPAFETQRHQSELKPDVKKQVRFCTEVHVFIFDQDKHFPTTEGCVSLESDVLRTFWHLYGQICPDHVVCGSIERWILLGEDDVPRDMDACSRFQNGPSSPQDVFSDGEFDDGTHQMAVSDCRMHRIVSHTPDAIPFSLMLRDGQMRSQRHCQSHEWLQVILSNCSGGVLHVEHSFWLRLDVGIDSIEMAIHAEVFLHGWSVNDVSGHWIRTDVGGHAHEVVVLANKLVVKHEGVHEMPSPEHLPVVLAPNADDVIALQGWSQCLSCHNLAFAGVTDEWGSAIESSWGEDSSSAFADLKSQFAHGISGEDVIRIETWYLSVDAFRVCIHPRTLFLRRYDTFERFQHACQRRWADVWDQNTEVNVFTVDSHEVCPPGSLKVMIVQGQLNALSAIMVTSQAFPALQQHRAVIVPIQCTVFDVFQQAQFRDVCLRERYTCSLAVCHEGRRMIFSDSELVHLTSGMCVQGVIDRIEDVETDDDESLASVVTSVGTSSEDTEDDLHSLMSIMPSWVAHSGLTLDNQLDELVEDENTHVWELQPEDVEDNVADLTPHFSEILDCHLRLMQELDDGATYTVVTFGIGLVDVGRRDFVTSTPDPTTMLEQIKRLWSDHVGRANVEIFLVQDQPTLPIHGRYLVFLVAFQYEGCLQEAILCQQVGGDGEAIESRPHAVRINGDATPFGLLSETGLDEGVYPQGVRDSIVKCRGRVLPEGRYSRFQSGDFCTIYIGSYPRHVERASVRFARAEHFFRDVRWVQQEFGSTSVLCHVHGLSPGGLSLDARGLLFTFEELVSEGWITQVQEFWLFSLPCTMMAYSHHEDPASSGANTFHFIVSFANVHRHVPVLLRQAIYAAQDDTAHLEYVVCNVPVDVSQDGIHDLVRQPPFWSGFQTASYINVRGAQSGPYPGARYDVWFQVRRREDILRNLLNIPAVDEVDEADAMSLLQVHSTLQKDVSAQDEFTEMCLELSRPHEDAFNLEGSEDKGQIQRVSSMVSSDSDACTRTLDMDEQLRTLHDILEELQQPWQGLNDDWTQIPHLHPMAQWAIDTTKRVAAPSRKLHIFTDGSSKQGGWDLGFCCGLPRRVFPNSGLPSCWVCSWTCVLRCRACGWQCPRRRSNSDCSHGRVCIELHCHFDSTAAGWGALGCQATPTWHGDRSPRQRLARILMSLVERKCSKVQGFHVHAHEGCPYNEAADSIAGAVRHGWQPEVTAVLRSKLLANHPLCEWAWIDILPPAQSSLPSSTCCLLPSIVSVEVGLIEH